MQHNCDTLSSLKTNEVTVYLGQQGSGALIHYVSEFYEILTDEEMWLQKGGLRSQSDGI